ncbi:MAG: SCP2 sterol-binding domain-containing protein [Actinomycetota bacterium]|nr:SCP2 sterol-binding domain-containing protein [Actinomycetota bacterium]
MPLFPSDEWMAEFCRRLAAHPDADDLARALDGVYEFVIEPAGPLTQRHRYRLAIRSTGAGAQIVPIDGAAGTRLTITADYQRWRQMISGKMDIGMAVLLRRVRVSGDLSGLTSQLSSAQPLVQALSSVPTEFLDQS